MKLLRVQSRGFKNCADGFGIDMIARSKKTSEDKEYELLEVDEELYVYSTVGIVGKNASGKTSTLDLLDWCYDILGSFRLRGKHCNYEGIFLEIIFYENGYVYRYTTELGNSVSLDDMAIFKNQKIFRKKYYKTKIKQIYMDDWEEGGPNADVPEDYSIVFSVLRKSNIRDIYYESSMDSPASYRAIFKLMEITKLDTKYCSSILRIFDSNIKALTQIDDTNYTLNYQGRTQTLSNVELYRFLSSGTTKGFNLYILAVMSLTMGFDLLIDEIENHFHKTLVENLIMLYKDKQVNRKNASLIFSTHYCELLDLFNRSDNIWITHSRDKIEIDNMYEKYDVRTELLKSRKFYQNAFETAVNYDALMDLKKELMQ